MVIEKSTRHLWERSAEIDDSAQHSPAANRADVWIAPQDDQLKGHIKRQRIANHAERSGLFSSPKAVVHPPE